MGRQRYQIEPGREFGRWTVINAFQKGGKTRALCRCQCGTERELCARKLMIGKSKSCGCSLLRLGGRSKSRDYMTWTSRASAGILCPEWMDAKIYLDYVQNLPGYGVPGARLTRIKLRFPFRPSNVEWRVKGKPAASVAP